MTHEEAIAIVNRYNRFNVVMELLTETLQVQPKTLGELAEAMKNLQKDHENAALMIRNTLTGEKEVQVAENVTDES